MSKSVKEMLRQIFPLTLKRAGLVFALTLVLLTGGWYVYKDKMKTQERIADVNANLNPKEAKTLLQKVGRHVSLPKNETPTIATVSDINKLKNQEFFAQAQNGDKVLIFMIAKKAYLYRQSIDKVIDIAPVNLPTPALAKKDASGSAQPGQIKAVKVAIINGTPDQSLLLAAQQKILQGTTGNLALIPQGSAKTTTYKETLVVDATGTNKDLQLNIANLLGGKAEDLPDTETPPQGVDIIVIIGNSFEQ